MSESSKKVNIVTFIMRELNAKRDTVLWAIHHGQVYIDHVCISMADVERWTESQLTGRMLKITSRQVRMFGSRKIDRDEHERLILEEEAEKQMELL